MTITARTVAHKHMPLYRVIRRGWADPLDTSYSQRASADNRWNTPDFPALYSSCSERVARAVARDVFRSAAIELADLQGAMLPELVEIAWAGEVVDVASLEGEHKWSRPTMERRGGLRVWLGFPLLDGFVN